MPYQRISQLPKSFKNYTSHGKTAGMKAFNNALNEYNGDEGTAYAVAHHAAQQAEAAVGHPVRAPKPRTPKVPTL